MESLEDPPTVDSTYSEIEDWIFKCAHSTPIRNILKEYTPFQEAPALSSSTNNKVYFKREDCSPINSFKLRGAFTKITKILNSARKFGVYACSAGNHASGVACSSHHYGISSKIYMPNGATDVKLNKVKNFGSEIVQVGYTTDDCFVAAKQSNENRILIHPFDDPYIIGGVGTIALEISDQIDISTVEYVFCPIGGGGLISGLGAVLKKLNPEIKIIGVEAAEANAMAESLSLGHIAILDAIGKFSDGTAIKTVGNWTFKIAQSVVEDVVIVSTKDICKAISMGFSDLRIILEPAGALAIAGLQKFTEDHNIRGKNCIAICSGSNVDFKLIRFISEIADISEKTISVVMSEEPGKFNSVFDLIKKCEITGISYNKSMKNPNSYLLMNIRFKLHEEFLKIMKSLEFSGYHPMEIADDHFASYHGKFLTIGRNYFNENELLLRFEFYSSNITMDRVFTTLATYCEICLVHFRNYGSEAFSILIGVQSLNNIKFNLDSFVNSMAKLNIKVKDETHNPFVSRFFIE